MPYRVCTHSWKYWNILEIYLSSSRVLETPWKPLFSEILLENYWKIDLQCRTNVTKTHLCCLPAADMAPDRSNLNLMAWLGHNQIISKVALRVLWDILPFNCFSTLTMVIKIWISHSPCSPTGGLCPGIFWFYSWNILEKSWNFVMVREYEPCETNAWYYHE